MTAERALVIEILHRGILAGRLAVRRGARDEVYLMLDLIHNLPGVLRDEHDIDRWLAVDLAEARSRHGHLDGVRDIANLANRLLPLRRAGPSGPARRSDPSHPELSMNRSESNDWHLMDLVEDVRTVEEALSDDPIALRVVTQVALAPDEYRAWRGDPHGAQVLGRVLEGGAWSLARPCIATFLEDRHQRVSGLPSPAAPVQQPTEEWLQTVSPYLADLDVAALRVYQEKVAGDPATRAVIRGLEVLHEQLRVLELALVAGLFHRYQALVGQPPPGDGDAAAVLGAFSSKARVLGLDDSDARLCAAALRATVAWAGRKKAPDWAIERLLDEGATWPLLEDAQHAVETDPAEDD